MRHAEAANAAAGAKPTGWTSGTAAEVERVADKVMEDFPAVGVVVNNAGIVRNNAAAMMSDEQWQDVIATDLSGPFFVIRSFLAHLMSRRWGRIINISSLAQEGSSGQVNYAAAKAGLIGLTKTLAREYGPRGITVQRRHRGVRGNRHDGPAHGPEAARHLAGVLPDQADRHRG